MDDSIQRLPACVVAEDRGGDFFPIEAAVREEDLVTEELYDRSEALAARRDGVAGKLIRIDHGHTSIPKSPRDGALARRDAARESEEMHARASYPGILPGAMLLSHVVVRMMLEAAEAAGLPRARVLAELPDPDERGAARLDWGTYASMLERMSALVDHDPERLRDIGAKVTRVPSSAFMQRLARGTVSIEALYWIASRWVSLALFPHLEPLTIEPSGTRRVRVRGAIPEPYAPSLPFLYVCEGTLRETPRMLGLPAATLITSDTTERQIAFVLELAESQPLPLRVWRRVRSIVRSRDHLAFLEEQRRALADSFEQLRAVSEEFRRLVDGLPDPVAIQRDGILLYVNRACVRGLGYDDASELVGRSVVKIIHPSSRQVAIAHMAMPIGSQPELTQMNLLRRDGGIVVAEMAQAQRIVFGGAEARLVLGRDVTERVRMQERLVTADRLSSLALLAAGVAHEINNPIAYVLGSIENARRNIEASPPDHEQALSALSTALEGVDRVRLIVRDLGVLSRVDEHAMQSVDVHAVLDSTLTLAGSQVSGLARIVREYGEIPEARMNAARLGQVFLNLMVNAIEAMDQRQVSEREVRVRTSTDGDGRPVIEVSDTGSGIPPELVERIFDPFFTTKPDGRNTGLGLAICHRLVVEAGGEITVDTAPGRGSTFRLTLPPASE